MRVAVLAIVIGVVAIAVLMIVQSARARAGAARQGDASAKPPSALGGALRARLASRGDWIVYVRRLRSEDWSRATRYTPDEIVTAGARFAVAEVRHYVIAYPNLQVVDASARAGALPAGVTGLAPGRASDATFDPAEVERGLALVDVRHTGPSRAGHYRTALSNRTSQPVRVARFVGTIPREGRLVVNTVTGDWYSAEEFVAWYGAPADGWIPAGVTFADPDNYGGGDSVWVYECERRDGTRFLTGRPVVL